MSTPLFLLLLFCQDTSYQSIASTTEINPSADSITIINKINSTRDKLNLDGLIVDSVLSQASELIDTTDPSQLIDAYGHNQVNLLNFLRGKHIFDYGIRSVVLEANSMDEINFEQNTDLLKVISSQTFNRIGFSIFNHANTTIVKLVLSEHYIEFAPRWNIESVIAPCSTGGMSFYVIMGLTETDSVYYDTTRLEELPDSFIPKSKIRLEFSDEDELYKKLDPKTKLSFDHFEPLLKKKVQNEDLNYFKLKLLNSSKNIVFMDSNGKILAFFKFDIENRK